MYPIPETHASSFIVKLSGKLSSHQSQRGCSDTGNCWYRTEVYATTYNKVKKLIKYRFAYIHNILYKYPETDYYLSQ